MPSEEKLGKEGAQFIQMASPGGWEQEDGEPFISEEVDIIVGRSMNCKGYGSGIFLKVSRTFVFDGQRLFLYRGRCLEKALTCY